MPEVVVPAVRPFDYLFVESTWISEPLPVAEPRLGRRTVLTLPLFPPPQKNWSRPSDSSPETYTPVGISILSWTSPVRGSTRLKSLCSPSQVPCHSSPSTQVTPVTKRLDSMVRRTAPVSGSIWWIFRSRYWPTQSVPSPHASPESPPPPGAGIVESTRPVFGSIFWMRFSAIWNRCSPSNAVPACPATSSERSFLPLSGSKAFSRSPEANQTCLPSNETPLTRSASG